MQKNKQIAKLLKKEILLAMQEPSAVLAQIARKYGISRNTLYSWKKSYKEPHSKAGHTKIANDDIDKFIELSVKNVSSSTLQKASFTFSDYSFSIEGEIKSNLFIYDFFYSLFIPRGNKKTQDCVERIMTQRLIAINSVLRFTPVSII